MRHDRRPATVTVRYLLRDLRCCRVQHAAADDARLDSGVRRSMPSARADTGTTPRADDAKQRRRST